MISDNDRSMLMQKKNMPTPLVRKNLLVITEKERRLTRKSFFAVSVIDYKNIVWLT